MRDERDRLAMRHNLVHHLRRDELELIVIKHGLGSLELKAKQLKAVVEAAWNDGNAPVGKSVIRTLKKATR
jgi:hypothetical protein